MARNSWDSNTLEVGDMITAIGSRLLDGSKILRLQKIVMFNGKKLFLCGRH